MANTCQLPGKPSQAWNASHQQYADGAMNGFVQSDSGPVAMGYWTGDDIPFYYALANTFPLCDRWFGSCLAQTFPNRRYLLAATSQGTTNNDLSFLTEGPPPAGGTIMELLNKHSIPWRDYYTSLPSVGLYLPVLNANGDKVVKIEQFFVDAAAGALPAFCLVEPDYDRTSEENSEDITLGEAFTAKVVQAAMNGPGWNKTLLVWCYDEHGGYYDHVPPLAAIAPDDIAPIVKPGDRPGDFARYGFRVPAVIVSPWARRDYVSHVVHDHTSILKLLQRKFNLPALTNRDANADDLLDSLDFDHDPAFLTPPSLPASRNDGVTALCAAAGPVPNPLG
jgi:phospholipase C